MKNKLKHFSTLALIFLLALTFLFNTSANDEISWYFKKNNEHKQPSLDKNLEFINKYNCYYLDSYHNDTSLDKVIYLTFDAGYENGNITRILDVLKEKDVTGAFFVLGHLINNNTDLVKRMVNEGHLVCNHTMSHKNMAKITNEAEFISEIEKLEKLYTEKIGAKMPKFYRPPEGRFTEDNLRILEKMGYKTILWSFAYADWDNNKQMSPTAALQKLINGVHNGEILLLHPTSKTNAGILGEFIDSLKLNGYRFGSLNDL